jgi:hypothetical protein
MARTNLAWVAQVSLLRPGFLSQKMREMPARCSSCDIKRPLLPQILSDAAGSLVIG